MLSNIFNLKEEMNKNLKRLSIDLEANIKNILDEIKIKHIILDCSCINNIDSQGVSALAQVKNSLKFSHILLINFNLAI